jgi:hypothetical protein
MFLQAELQRQLKSGSTLPPTTKAPNFGEWAYSDATAAKFRAPPLPLGEDGLYCRELDSHLQPQPSNKQQRPQQAGGSPIVASPPVVVMHGAQFVDGCCDIFSLEDAIKIVHLLD